MDVIPHICADVPTIAVFCILWFNAPFIVSNYWWATPALVLLQNILASLLMWLFVPIDRVQRSLWSLSCFERYADEFNSKYRYRWSNGEIPCEVRALESTVNDYEGCRMCFECFRSDSDDDVVLGCGHRFHAHCIREWERNQYCAKRAARWVEGRPPLPASMCQVYECALCRAPYRWTQKWLIHSAR